MSSKKLRTDKRCLNCGHTVEVRYCSQCGQENRILEDSAIHIIVHYLQDLLHYDGKFWHTLKGLLTRPGLVAREYLEGKRQGHLEPVRFYVFASTAFFVVFFFIVGKEPLPVETSKANYDKRIYQLEQEKEFISGTPDTLAINMLIASLRKTQADSMYAVPDSLREDLEIDLFDVKADTNKATGWLEKVLMSRIEAKSDELENAYEGDERKAVRAVLDEILHSLPQLFFLSMPFFALFLLLLYWRKKHTSYVEHFIFSIYHYAYLFVIFLCFALIRALLDKVKYAWVGTLEDWLAALMFLYPFIYLYYSLKRFYTDKGGWLVIRYSILVFLFTSSILILFVVLALFTFLF